MFSREPNRGLFYRNEKENETEKLNKRRGNTSYHNGESYAGGDGGREREVSGYWLGFCVGVSEFTEKKKEEILRGFWWQIV